MLLVRPEKPYLHNLTALPCIRTYCEFLRDFSPLRMKRTVEDGHWGVGVRAKSDYMLLALGKGWVRRGNLGVSGS